MAENGTADECTKEGERGTHRCFNSLKVYAESKLPIYAYLIIFACVCLVCGNSRRYGWDRSG